MENDNAFIKHNYEDYKLYEKIYNIWAKIPDSKLQLTLEKQGFELHVSTNAWNFFNKFV